jgi:hypothetical protein
MTVPQNLALALALLAGVAFAIYAGTQTKALPSLVDVFQVVLGVAAIYSGCALCYKVLKSTTKMGDLADSRLMIALGGVAVAWVALTTIIDVVRKSSGPPTASEGVSRAEQ